METVQVLEEKAALNGQKAQHVEQERSMERVNTIDIDNYQGLTITCVLVYLVRSCNSIF
jgi:hypothetical protein